MKAIYIPLRISIRMGWDRLRAWIDLSRIHGTPFIIGVFMAGMLSGPDARPLCCFAVSFFIIFFFKTAGAVYNEITDLGLDARDHAHRTKPIQSGKISVAAAKVYVALCIAAGTVLATVFLPFAATLLIIVAFLITCVYSSWGKFKPVAFETLFPLAITIVFVAGAVTGGGLSERGLFLSFVVFTAVMHGQWLNELRDVSADRRGGAGSFAVRSGFDPRTGKSGLGRNIAFGGLIWLCHIVSVLAIFYLELASCRRGLVVLGLMALTTLVIYHNPRALFGRRHNNKVMTTQVVGSLVIIAMLLIDRAGLARAGGLVAFVVFGTVFAVLLERGQYKTALFR